MPQIIIVLSIFIAPYFAFKFFIAPFLRNLEDALEKKYMQKTICVNNKQYQIIVFYNGIKLIGLACSICFFLFTTNMFYKHLVCLTAIKFFCVGLIFLGIFGCFVYNIYLITRKDFIKKTVYLDEIIYICFFSWYVVSFCLVLDEIHIHM